MDRAALAQLLAQKQPDPTAGKGGLDYLWRFFNPFSTPPGSSQEGPSLRDVIVPPSSSSKPVDPPGIGEFLNPASQPPVQNISMQGNRPFERPLSHAEEMERPGAPLPAAPLPQGWIPPGANWMAEQPQPPPRGQPDPNWYDPQPHPAPNFHVPPGKVLKPRGFGA